MLTIDRRTFLRFLTSVAATAAFPQSIERALAIPAHHRTGTIGDVEHIVFLMQENRAFDHYFGTLRGVRGFGDPRPMTLPSGKPVWFQPDGAGFRLPFHPTVANFGLAFLEDTPHGWPDTHAEGTADLAHGSFRIDFANTGEAGACFQVLSGNAADLPRTYTLEVGKSLFDSWQTVQGQYDLSAFGPNGFLRAFRGSASPAAKANLTLESRYDVDDDAVILTITNLGTLAARVTVSNAYGNDRAVTRLLRPGHSDRQRWELKKSFGWYDLSVVTDADPGFLRRLAGHLENGRDSVSDPAFGNGHG
jgi:hypothetical protein